MRDLQPPVLVVQKHIKASIHRVFSAWTTPEHLTRWWGPSGIDCTEAEVDLRVGGGFRLANLLPDGTTIWIAGIYEEIDVPNRLVHTWFVESDPNPSSERVTIEFVEADGGTHITVTHTGITTEPARESHEGGWIGCLERLTTLLET